MVKQAAVIILMGAILWIGWTTEKQKRETVSEMETFIRLTAVLTEEICGRASLLEKAFSLAASYCTGRTATIAVKMQQLMQTETPADAWRQLIAEEYADLSFCVPERLLMEGVIDSCLLPGRQAIREQLTIDRHRLEELCGERKARLTNEVRLCRGMSFCGAFFLLIAVW